MSGKIRDVVMEDAEVGSAPDGSLGYAIFPSETRWTLSPRTAVATIWNLETDVLCLACVRSPTAAARRAARIRFAGWSIMDSILLRNAARWPLPVSLLLPARGPLEGSPADHLCCPLGACNRVGRCSARMKWKRMGRFVRRLHMGP